MVHGLVVVAVLAGAPPELPAAPDDAPAPLTLRWNAPASCPDEAAVVAAITARQPVDPVVVAVDVTVDAEVATAELSVDSAHGATRRRLESPSCTSIVEAIALLVQVAADPLPTPARIAPQVVVAPPVEPEPPVEPALEELANPTTTRPPIAPTPRAVPERSPVRARLSAAAIVGAGTVPVVDAGGRVMVGIASRWVLADVGAAVLAPQRAATRSDLEVRIDAFAAVARVCPVIPTGLRRLELSACAVATAGALRGRSQGAAVVGSGRGFQPWVRLAAAPELAVVVHPRVRLTATVEAGGHVVRPGFAIARLGRVWAPRPWAIHGGLGVEVRLP